MSGVGTPPPASTGGDIPFTCDSNDNLTSEIDADGRAEAISYDPWGNATGTECYSSAGTPVESFSFGYDGNNNRILVQDVIGGWSSW